MEIILISVSVSVWVMTTTLIPSSPAGGIETLFDAVCPVFDSGGGAGKDLLDIGKVQPVFFQVCLPLGFVPGKVHE